MGIKKCAYCGKEAKGTREHIISSGILDLFPECFLTINDTTGTVYEADPVIKDVCSDCNNSKLTYIDSYAKSIVEKYFLEKYDKDKKLEFTYNHNMMQKVLLKYAYNDLRAHKQDTSFFDEEILSYLLREQDSKSKKNVVILGGLAVNTSPAPDYLFGNQKLKWSRNPALLSNSIIMNLDYHTGEIILREDCEKEKIEELLLSYVFRFNSGQFILLCFDKNISDDRLEMIKTFLRIQYPYTVLTEEGEIELSRCTSETTYHIIGLIDVSWGQELADASSELRGLANPEGREWFEKMTAEWEQYEKTLAQEHKRKG